MYIRAVAMVWTATRSRYASLKNSGLMNINELIIVNWLRSSTEIFGDCIANTFFHDGQAEMNSIGHYSHVLGISQFLVVMEHHQTVKSTLSHSASQVVLYSSHGTKCALRCAFVVVSMVAS